MYKLKMVNQKQNIEKIKLKILPILERYGIVRAGIFGSYVRGEQKKRSDIDILIKYPRGLGFRFARIQLDLKEKLGKKVHLVTYNSIHPRLKEQILKEEIRLL